MFVLASDFMRFFSPTLFATFIAVKAQQYTFQYKLQRIQIFCNIKIPLSSQIVNEQEVHAHL